MISHASVTGNWYVTLSFTKENKRFGGGGDGLEVLSLRFQLDMDN
jgi:hypothetical protein